MSSFTDKLKELVGEATKGPWSFEGCGSKGQGAYMIGVSYGPDDPNCERPIAGEFDPDSEAKYNEETGDYDYPDYYRDELVAECDWEQTRDSYANAALIVHLRNHAEDIVALVEALERIREEDRTGPEVYESAPTAGRPHRMRCVGNAMGRSGEIASAALSRLEAKP